MKRIISFSKPYLPMITIAIVLLFIQANANLALPDYLSDIVNVGIQQGGIEDTVPVAITELEMNRTLLFVNETSDRIEVLSHYENFDNESTGFDKYINIYPVISTEPIYVLKSLTGEEHERLVSIMAKPLVIVYFLKLMVENVLTGLNPV